MKSLEMTIHNLEHEIGMGGPKRESLTETRNDLIVKKQQCFDGDPDVVQLLQVDHTKLFVIVIYVHV